MRRHVPRVFHMKPSRAGMVLATGLTLCGCSLESTHELLSTSPLPSGIAHDLRMRGMGPVCVTTEGYTDDTTVATIRSLQHHVRFKVYGTIAVCDPPEEHPHRWCETYNSETDVCEYVVPDYYHVRIVKLGAHSK